MNWGSAAEWANVVAAIVALSGAFWAVRESRRIYTLEKQRDINEVLTQQRYQASQFTAWISAHIDDEGCWQQLGITLQNLSTNPIYDIAIQSTTLNQDNACELGIGILPPGTYHASANINPQRPNFREFIDPATLRTIQKQCSSDFRPWKYPEILSTIQPAVRPMTDNGKRKIVRICFTDNMGQRWIRNEKGMLQSA